VLEATARTLRDTPSAVSAHLTEVGRNRLLVIAALTFGVLAIGALSPTSPKLAATIVFAVCVVCVIAAKIETLPLLLVFTLYAEGVSLGGFNIGRPAGVLALAALAYYLLLRGKADLPASSLLVIAATLGFWILLSSYWATNRSMVFTSFFKFALSFAFALVFAVLVRSESQLENVFKAFVAAAVIFGAVSVVEYILSGGAAVGWNAYATGLQGDHNLFAAYQGLALAPALVLARRELVPQIRLAYYAAVVFIVVSIGISFSRGGLIALLAMILATLVLPWRVFFRRATQKLAYLLSLIFGAWVVLVLGSTQYLGRIETIFSGGDRGSGRIDLWSAAWNGYIHHPWLGLGAGGFEGNSLSLLQNTPGVDLTASYIGPNRPVHNSYLETLTDLGPVGLVLFLALGGLTLWFLLRAARRYRVAGKHDLQRMTLALAVSLLGISVSAFFLSIEYGKPIWILTGLALALDRHSAKQGEEETAGAGRQSYSERAPAVRYLGRAPT
jgi:O-antigen ligase